MLMVQIYRWLCLKCFVFGRVGYLMALTLINKSSGILITKIVSASLKTILVIPRVLLYDADWSRICSTSETVKYQTIKPVMLSQYNLQNRWHVCVAVRSTQVQLDAVMDQDGLSQQNAINSSVFTDVCRKARFNCLVCLQKSKPLLFKERTGFPNLYSRIDIANRNILISSEK